MEPLVHWGTRMEREGKRPSSPFLYRDRLSEKSDKIEQNNSPIGGLSYFRLVLCVWL